MKPLQEQEKEGKQKRKGKKTIENRENYTKGG